MSTTVWTDEPETAEPAWKAVPDFTHPVGALPEAQLQPQPLAERVRAARTGGTAQRGKKPAPSRFGKLYGTSMRVIRRVHLYTGLLMLPFVLLYGISAMYFNHPTLLNRGSSQEFTAESLPANGATATADPRALAAQALALINAAQHEAGDSEAEASIDRPRLALRDANSARILGSMSYTFRNEEQQLSVSFNPTTGSALVRGNPLNTANEPTRDARPNPFARLPEFAELREIAAKGKLVAVNSLSAFRGGESIDPAALQRGGRGGSRLQFDAVAGDETYRISYDLETGRGTASPWAKPAEIGTERFLMRLHTAHGYPDEFGVRWCWAFIVDAMFVNMVLWGLSGVLMWWQLKKTRKWGAAALIASAVMTCWLFAGMHTQMVESAQTRGVGRGGEPQVAPSTESPASEGRGRGGRRSGEERGRVDAAREGRERGERIRDGDANQGDGSAGSTG